MILQRNASVLALIFVAVASMAMAQELHPGVDRWAIKTSLPLHPKHRTVSLDTLLSLANPIEHNTKAFDSERIHVLMADSLKEGDLVTTEGWIELVALEDDSKKHRDGDYHIQIRNSKEWGDTCLIVEIPLPEFIEDASLRDSCEKTRAFIRTRLLKNREPSKKGTVIVHAAYVRITGQLFFDAAHLKGGLRGKSPKGYSLMHSYTAWELHPIVAIEFAAVTK